MLLDIILNAKNVEKPFFSCYHMVNWCQGQRGWTRFCEYNPKGDSWKQCQGKAGINPLLEQNDWKIDIYYQFCTRHLDTHNINSHKSWEGCRSLSTVMKVQELSWSQSHMGQSQESNQGQLTQKHVFFLQKQLTVWKAKLQDDSEIGILRRSHEKVQSFLNTVNKKGG